MSGTIRLQKIVLNKIYSELNTERFIPYFYETPQGVVEIDNIKNTDQKKNGKLKSYK